jgi:hypothetical protein
MHQNPHLYPVTTLAVGIVVFGGTVAVLVHWKPFDPRVALAGLLAAAALTVALLTMIWARRRTGSGHASPSIRSSIPGGAPVTSEDRLTVIDLGQGQAAVIFAEPAPHPTPLQPGPHLAASSVREAEATADAIYDAVAAAVEAAGKDEAPSSKEDITSPFFPPGGPGLWSRLRARRTARGGARPDSR